MFAGPNGSGKSTFVARHAVDQQIDVVNPDVIANRIDPSHKGDTAVLMQAGREALSALAEKALREFRMLTPYRIYPQRSNV